MSWSVSRDPRTPLKLPLAFSISHTNRARTYTEWQPQFNCEKFFSKIPQLHFIAGVGDLNSLLLVPLIQQGHIEDVAASPNDPLFIVHHLMIDCVLEEYLRKYPDTEYPTDPLVRDGHRADDYSRGFFPLYTNKELFVAGENFGYSCILAEIPDSDAAAANFVLSPALLLLSMLIAVMANSLLSK